MTWVMAAGGRIGLNAGNSDADGGWSFTFMICYKQDMVWLYSVTLSMKINTRDVSRKVKKYCGNANA